MVEPINDWQFGEVELLGGQWSLSVPIEAVACWVWEVLVAEK